MKQAEEIARALPSVRFEIVEIETKGDKDRSTPISACEGTDFFTREIEDALIEGKIDAAIHSAKDLENAQPDELTIAAMTSSISRYDCLVSNGGKILKDLPSGAVIGTSSKKRKAAILRYRPDLTVKDIRGNIGERLEKLDRGDLDAIIVAHAALLRLGLEERIAEIIPENMMEPHPRQGSLAVQVRKDRRDIIEIFRSIDGK